MYNIICLIVGCITNNIINIGRQVLGKNIVRVWSSLVFFNNLIFTTIQLNGYFQLINYKYKNRI